MSTPSRPSSSLVRLANQLEEEVARLRASLATAQAEAEQVKTLVAQARQAVLLVDGHRLLYANPALCALFGYESLEEMSGLPFPQAFLMESEKAPAQEFWRQALSSPGGPRRHEFQGRRKDGQPVWVQIIVQAVTWRGTPALLGICHALDSRKAAEEAMRVAQARFQDLMEFSSDSIWELGPDLRFNFHRPGLTPQGEGLAFDPIGRFAWDLLAPDTDPAIRQKLSADLQAHLPVREFLYPYQDKVGRKRFARASGRPLFDAEGRFTGYRGMSHDVTREMEAYEQARLAHVRLMAAIDSLPMLFCLYDAQRRLLLTNNKVRDFFPRVVHAFVPGATFEAILRACAPNVKDAQGREEAWVATRTAEFEGSREAYEQELLDGRCLLVVDRRTPDGCTVSLRFDITERRQAQLALQRAAAMLAQSQSLAHLGSWERDLTNQRVEWSQETFRIMGQDPAKFVPTPESFFALVHPDDRGDLQERVQHGLRSGSPHDQKFRVVHPDGKVVVVHGRFTSVRDAAGNVTRAVGAVQDITERAEAEQELLLSRAALDSGLSPIAFMDLEGRFTYVNPALLQLLGYAEPSELLGKAVGPFFQTPEPPKVLQKRIVEMGRYSGELKAICKNGDLVDVEVMASLVRDAREVPVRIMMSFNDITHRKREEAALLARVEAETRYRTLLESMNIGMNILQDGRLAYANPAFARITGYSEEELLASSAEQVAKTIYRGDRERIMDRAARRVRGESLEEQAEMRLVRKDGRVVWLEISSAVVQYNGRPAIQLLALDITERKRMQEQLRRGQMLEAVGQLAGGVAHDFNNLLQIMDGYTQLAMQHAAPGQQQHSDLRQVAQAIEKASRLTQQLLTFTRKQTLQQVPLDVNPLLRDIAQRMERDGEPQITVELVLQPNLGLVDADPGLLEQALANLCGNARDAMPAGGTLRLRSSRVILDGKLQSPEGEPRRGLHACIEIADTGSGMPPEVLDHIFEPFYTTKATGMGTGMGLSTAYGIVNQHRGYIEVDSQVGKGSRFRIFLPLREEPRQAK